jgi:hypothetical protein
LKEREAEKRGKGGKTMKKKRSAAKFGNAAK